MVKDRQFVYTRWRRTPAQMSDQEILAMLASLDVKPCLKLCQWRWRILIAAVIAIFLFVLLSEKKWGHQAKPLAINNAIFLNADSLPPASLLHDISLANAQVELDTQKDAADLDRDGAIECTRKHRKHAVPNYDKADKLIKVIAESDKSKLPAPFPASQAHVAPSAGQTNRDIVIRTSGQSTEALVKRCRALGLLEGELCRIRICSGLWGSDPACPGHGNRTPEHS